MIIALFDEVNLGTAYHVSGWTQAVARGYAATDLPPNLVALLARELHVRHVAAVNGRLPLGYMWVPAASAVFRREDAPMITIDLGAIMSEAMPEAWAAWDEIELAALCALPPAETDVVEIILTTSPCVIIYKRTLATYASPMYSTNPRKLRLLAAIRLSHVTDATTSPERQLQACQAWADREGHEIVGVAADLDVSGAVHPFRRRELGPWINFRAHEFDGIIFHRQDRLSRKLFDFVDMWRWADENKKALISVEMGLDYSTGTGRDVAMSLAQHAEREREIMRARILDAQSYLIAAGKFTGGDYPFWLKPKRHPSGKGWRLEWADDTTIKDAEGNDLTRVAIIQRIVADVLALKPYTQIAEELYELGIPNPKTLKAGDAPTRGTTREGEEITYKGIWSGRIVKYLCTIRLLIGERYRIKTGETVGYVVTDPTSGLPIEFADQVIDFSEWQELQRITSTNRMPGRPKAKNSPLRDVLLCGHCGGGLTPNNTTKRGKLYRYFRCNNRFAVGMRPCPNVGVTADKVYDAIETQVLGDVGDAEMFRRVVHAGFDNRAEYERMKENLARLMEQDLAEASKARQEMTARQIDRLDREIAAMENNLYSPPTVEHIGTGRTFREMWEAASDWTYRGSLLRQAGIEVRATAHVVQVNIPEDYRERVASDLPPDAYKKAPYFKVEHSRHVTTPETALSATESP